MNGCKTVHPPKLHFLSNQSPQYIRVMPNLFVYSNLKLNGGNFQSIIHQSRRAQTLFKVNMKKPVVHHQADEQNLDSKDINYNAAFKAYIDLRVHNLHMMCLRVRMYGNRVKNDRNIFEIPALLSCEQGNSQWGKFKIIYIFLNFPALLCS